MESRVLGPVELVGGLGGAVFETSTELSGATVPFRLEVDYPARFDERQLAQLDAILLGWERIDTMARDALVSALDDPDSAPSALLREWEEESEAREGDTRRFLAELKPKSVTILWDAAGAYQDRIVMPYGYSLAADSVILRFRDRVGVEIDPVRRAA
ncbi:hypothetical protein ACFXP7_06165 [Microbacterium sp. P06]|uniref:hypothetical protein n=1 Tax=Microbacterium sp. P06 TaxID=3366949 RepID=UPI0037461BAE